MRNGKTRKSPASPVLPGTWDRTGCELYAGEDSQKPGRRYFAHNRNWNLVLPEEGKLRAVFENARYTFGPRDLVLLAPGAPREFIVLEPLKVHWIHFNLDAHLQYPPEWPARGPGVFLLHPPASDRVEFIHLFSEISSLCRVRRAGWYRLGYCLIQEILLRGNMLNEQGLDQKSIDFAARILQDFSSTATMDELAERCSLSRAVFFRKFKKTFGMPPCEYREQQKLNAVRQELENGMSTLKELAEMHGFDSPFYLSARFRKMFGVSPKEYRRNYLDHLSREQ